MSNTVSIDSASLLIPLSHVTALDDTLKCIIKHNHCESLIVVNYDTQEFVDYLDAKIKDVVEHKAIDGTVTYYKIVNSNIGSTVYRDCLAISINSKMLGTAYLTGITQDTIRALYDSVMSQGIIDISYDAFANGCVTDVDIKQDTKLPEQYEDFNHLTQSIKDNARDEFVKAKAVKHYNQQGNQGIQFSFRGNGASLPFCKIYNKTVEMGTKSAEFAAHHNIIITHPVRIEVTLANKTQLRRFGLLADKGQRQTLINVINNLGAFDMRKVTSLYLDNIVKPSSIKATSDKEFVGMQKIELQCYKMTTSLLDMAARFGNNFIGLTELHETVLDAISPSSNNVKRCKGAIEMAHTMYYDKSRQHQQVHPINALFDNN